MASQDRMAQAPKSKFLARTSGRRRRTQQCQQIPQLFFEVLSTTFWVCIGVVVALIFVFAAFVIGSVA